MQKLKTFGNSGKVSKVKAEYKYIRSQLTVAGAHVDDGKSEQHGHENRTNLLTLSFSSEFEQL